MKKVYVIRLIVLWALLINIPVLANDFESKSVTFIGNEACCECSPLTSDIISRFLESPKDSKTDKNVVLYDTPVIDPIPTPPAEQCKKPTIELNNRIMSFSSETNDVVFYYTISTNGLNGSTISKVDLSERSLMLRVVVVASKEGYRDSDEAVAEFPLSLLNVIGVRGDQTDPKPVDPEPMPLAEQCKKPTIELSNRIMSFSSETSDVVFYYTIATNGVNGSTISKVDLSEQSLMLRVVVVASKEGYRDSDEAVAEFPLFVDNGIRGDVNGDGVVNNADIYEEVKMIFNDSINPKGDVNGDGIVNGADIVSIVNIFVNPSPTPTPSPTPVDPTPSSTFYQGGIYYKVGENKTVSVISGEVKYSGNVVIPKQVKYNGETYTVTSIGMSAFRGCSDLISVTIPNTVTHIGEEAFWCDNDISIHITDLEAWCKISFNFEAFSSYDGGGWTNYYHRLFRNGIEITDLVIPSGVKSIGFITFSNCTSITSVTIPNSVTFIGDRAFEGCSGLTSVFIPNSVTSIGSSAFADCSGLTTITLEIEKPFEIVSGTFSDYTYNVAELIVPYGTKAAYQATEGWNKFTMITEAQDKDVVTFTIDGITYEGSKSEKTVVVKAVDTKQTSVEIPASVSYDGINYQVSGITDGVFDGSSMAALIWDVDAALPNNAFSYASIGSNFLLYVKSSSYAPSTVRNVVANGAAQTIVLSDDGGQFYCPQTFTARSISYTHNYSMETGIGKAKGWEAIALPFDVQRIMHNIRGEIVPFASYSKDSNQKPFWLAYFSSSGFRRASQLQANEPYIIAMPNSSNYRNDYNLVGDVTFSADNVTIPKTPAFTGTFLPAFASVAQSSRVMALNVNNRYFKYSGSYDAGSCFIANLRDVLPFEAYMTGSSTRSVIEINFDDGTTDMENILFFADDDHEVTIYHLSGQKVARTTQFEFDHIWDSLPKGVYIVNGKKMIK